MASGKIAFGSPKENDWKQSEVSGDRTYHIIDGKPIYVKRYDEVLSFHEPGLAPASLDGKWFHITSDGTPAYTSTFDRTWGFYDGLAAASLNGRYFHVHPDGTRAYERDFVWCGNFQEGLCAVLDDNGMYYHISRNGSKAYASSYSYVGDFHEGYAVVRKEDGRCFHIDREGRSLYSASFPDLGTFHKGYATAYDGNGWFHINKQGNPIYEDRYSVIEPFYNGRALIRDKDGNVKTIDEKGHLLKVVSKTNPDLFAKVSHDLVGFWKSYLLWTAVEIGICDVLPMNSQQISDIFNMPLENVDTILFALRERRYVDFNANGDWKTTQIGKFLVRDKYNNIGVVFEHWIQQTMHMWEYAIESLKSGIPAFVLSTGNKFEDWLKKDQRRLDVFFLAMEEYAEKEYVGIGDTIEFESFKTLSIVGIGVRKLIHEAFRKNQFLKLILLGETLIPEYALDELTQNPKIIINQSKIISQWKFQTDAVIFSKVLSDWRDEDLKVILRNAINSLPHEGVIYVIDTFFQENSLAGGILSLHMRLLRGGGLRTYEDFQSILMAQGLNITETKILNSGLTLIKATKDGSSRK